MDNELSVHEALLLLALRDDEGTMERGTGMAGFALAGGVFAELLLRGRIDVESGKKPLVNLVDSSATGDGVLDEALGLVAKAKRRRRAQAWVMRFSNLRKLRHRIAGALCERGILREDEKSLLLVFTRRVYPTTNPVPEQKLIAELRGAVFSDAPILGERLLVITAVAHVSGLLRIPFERRELRARKKHLEALSSPSSDAVGAAAQAVRAAQATQVAVAAAVAASSAAAASS